MQKKLTILFLLLTVTWAQATLTLSQSFTPGNGGVADGNPVGVVFSGTFNQASPLEQVLGVTVNLSMSGGYNGDLFAYLITPNGTLVVLLDQPGVATNGFGAYGAGMNISLSDAGSTSIQNETSGNILSGTYQAAGNLSDFNGSLANGTWALFFSDISNGGGQSTVDSWSLNLTVVPEPIGLALILFMAMLLSLAGWDRILRARKESQ